MATNSAGKSLATAIGVVMGLLIAGVIVYMLGVRAHLWPPSPTGFWTF